jgi:two-component system, OmpR family, phosphate regulon sensor histidine kinase PhoR
MKASGSKSRRRMAVSDKASDAKRLLRSPVFRGALAAAAIMLAVAGLRGELDFAWLVAAALASIAGALLARAGARASTPVAVAAREKPIAAADTLAKIPDPVILVDRRAVVLEANEAARALLPALAIGHPLSFYLRSPDVLDGIGEVLKSGLARKIEYSERVPTERSFEVQIGRLAPAVAEGDGEGEPGVVLFFRDQTSARRLERMRVDFIANASHELRTPLASLLGFIETLQGPARDDAAARERFLEIMRGQANRMKRLIEDLLSLSRIELRAHVPPEAPLDLFPLVGQMIDTTTPLAREHGVDIAFEAEERPFTVLGDRDELLRVIENLLENAMKYGGTGKRIEIGLLRRAPAETRPGEVELTVRDYGPGISSEHLPRLTERFYRADVAESRQKGGTGLGLAIVKHIVARHRGKLAIDSEPGHGATFRVTLPAAPGKGLQPNA